MTLLQKLRRLPVLARAVVTLSALWGAWGVFAIPYLIAVFGDPNDPLRIPLVYLNLIPSMLAIASAWALLNASRWVLLPQSLLLATLIIKAIIQHPESVQSVGGEFGASFLGSLPTPVQVALAVNTLVICYSAYLLKTGHLK